MKKLRFIMLASVAFAAFALMISCSKNSDPNDAGKEGERRQVMLEADDIEKDASMTLYTPASTYLMRLNGETLTLYEITGSEEIAVTAINIDPSYYPPEDIKELNKGIIAYSKEDGFAKLENFTN